MYALRAAPPSGWTPNLDGDMNYIYDNLNRYKRGLLLEATPKTQDPVDIIIEVVIKKGFLSKRIFNIKTKDFPGEKMNVIAKGNIPEELNYLFGCDGFIFLLTPEEEVLLATERIYNYVINFLFKHKGVKPGKKIKTPFVLTFTKNDKYHIEANEGGIDGFAQRNIPEIVNMCKAKIYPDYWGVKAVSCIKQYSDPNDVEKNPVGVIEPVKWIFNKWM